MQLVVCYKPRLVAQDYKQEYVIIYFTTFNLVAKMPFIHILMSIALHNKWKIHQLDVSNVFLYGTIDITIYMKPPQGFIYANYPNQVCLLDKELYALK